MLHLLLKRNEAKCTEVARILLCRYTGLAKDIIIGEDFFGETALHEAIINGDSNLANTLLGVSTLELFRSKKNSLQKWAPILWHALAGISSNQMINERPSHRKRPIMKVVSFCLSSNKAYFEGFGYLGEYPLCFAAICDNKDIYDALLRLEHVEIA